MFYNINVKVVSVVLSCFVVCVCVYVSLLASLASILVIRTLSIVISEQYVPQSVTAASALRGSDRISKFLQAFGNLTFFCTQL